MKNKLQDSETYHSFLGNLLYKGLLSVFPAFKT